VILLFADERGIKEPRGETHPVYMEDSLRIRGDLENIDLLADAIQLEEPLAVR